MAIQDDNNGFHEIDRLLKGALKENVQPDGITLRERFEKRVAELNVSQAAALQILGIEWRSLNGILDGSQKRVDFSALSKLARFLGITYSVMIEMYLHNLEANYKKEIGFTGKGEFIQANLDLGTLKKAGIIDSINDFEHIETQVIRLLGLKSIFDYNRQKIDAAFSSGKIEPKNTLTRDFWIWYAFAQFEYIANPYEYSKETLIAYFPNIRRHSTDVENGLYEVVRSLYCIGITVIFQPYFPTLHLRGATLSVNDKPCVILTDYRGYYPTLWFALIHELFHVLFDWEEIISKTYHLSDLDTDDYNVIKKEQDANSFARDYLFSDEKMNSIRYYLHNDLFVDEFAKKNHVHPSIIYIFNAFDKGKDDIKVWPRAIKKTPPIRNALERLYYYEWEERKPFTEVAEIRMKTIFNNL